MAKNMDVASASNSCLDAIKLPFQNFVLASRGIEFQYLLEQGDSAVKNAIENVDALRGFTHLASIIQLSLWDEHLDPFDPSTTWHSGVGMRIKHMTPEEFHDGEYP